MRTDPASLVEKEFIIEGFRNGLRHDERSLDDFRQAVLALGKQPGTALCTLGRTKVVCAVSASIAEPTRTRPQKGIISIEVDMSPMASPAYEANRLGNKGLELTRLLEMVIRDSGCVDVEALCIRAREEVWKIRVDVRVLDDDGSLVDCASIAASAALRYYARPDVTVLPECTKIHSEYDKVLVPLSIYHMPICVSFGISRGSGITVVDATEKESLYLDGSLIIACNQRREVCVLHQSNNLILSTDQIMTCINRAMQRANDISELVLAVLADENKKKAKGDEGSGFESGVTAELLSCREGHPNELIAPAVEKGEEGERMIEGQVAEENALGDGAVEMDEEEMNDVDQQVGDIVSNVQDVTLEEKTGKNREPQNRQQDKQVVDSMLDDLLGETMQLGEEATMQSGEESQVDLLAAKKKKKRK